MLVSLHSKVASWLARFTLAGNLAAARVQQKQQKLHKLKVQAPSVAHQHPLHITSGWGTALGGLTSILPWEPTVHWIPRQD